MSYGNKCTSYWFDEFTPVETIFGAAMMGGLKHHKEAKVFEDSYGVFWSEEIVWSFMDKIFQQTLRKRKAQITELVLPVSSLVDTVTHLSLENLGRHLQKPKSVI